MDVAHVFQVLHGQVHALADDARVLVIDGPTRSGVSVQAGVRR